MKNPTDRDVIGRTAITAGTGFQAWRDGATPLEGLNIGFWWGWWYKNMTASLVLLVVVTLFAISTGQWEYVYVQAVLNTVVCGVTYCKLIRVSQFKQRWFFRLWWPVARLFPNTSRVWLYLSVYLPLWTLMWFQNHHYAGGMRW